MRGGGKVMSQREARFRRNEGISEGDTVSVFHGADRVTGVVEVVGWQTGTYKVRVGRRKHLVSMTQVRKVGGAVNDASERLRARDSGGYIQTGPDEEPRPPEGVTVCPRCETECWREEVDVGVGVLHGPWGCPECGWSEDPQYDQTSPDCQPRTDQFGGLYPK